MVCGEGGQAVRDVEIYQEVQWDEEKWLNQNCCLYQNMELEGTIV